MPRNDYQDTKHYIPPLLDDLNIPDEQKANLHKVQHRYIHEGRVVDAYFVPLDNIDVCFSTIDFDCLYKINDQICPRFILEFYSRVRTFSNIEGNVFLDFWIQNQNISLSITEFGYILGIPSYGQCAYMKTIPWTLSSTIWKKRIPISPNFPIPKPSNNMYAPLE